MQVGQRIRELVLDTYKNHKVLKQICPNVGGWGCSY